MNNDRKIYGIYISKPYFDVYTGSDGYINYLFFLLSS